MTKSKNGISPAVLVLALIGGGWWWLSQTGFSDADIASYKRQITDEYEKDKGAHVRDIVLVRESANKLTGYVKLHFDALNADISKNCSVTRDDSAGYWQCR